MLTLRPFAAACCQSCFFAAGRSSGPALAPRKIKLNARKATNGPYCARACQRGGQGRARSSTHLCNRRPFRRRRRHRGGWRVRLGDRAQRAGVHHQRGGACQWRRLFRKPHTRRRLEHPLCRGLRRRAGVRSAGAPRRHQLQAVHPASLVDAEADVLRHARLDQAAQRQKRNHVAVGRRKRVGRQAHAVRRARSQQRVQRRGVGCGRHVAQNLHLREADGAALVAVGARVQRARARPRRVCAQRVLQRQRDLGEVGGCETDAALGQRAGCTAAARSSSQARRDAPLLLPSLLGAPSARAADAAGAAAEHAARSVATAHSRSSERSRAMAQATQRLTAKHAAATPVGKRRRGWAAPPASMRWRRRREAPAQRSFVVRHATAAAPPLLVGLRCEPHSRR